MEYFDKTLLEISTLKNYSNYLKQIKTFLDSMNKRLLNRSKLYDIYLKQMFTLLSDNKNMDLLNNFPITLENLLNEYDEEFMSNESDLFFPGHVVLVYPAIRYYKARKNILCAFSSSIINVGDEYIYYRPLLDDITDHKSYILSPAIKASIGYEEYLPKSIKEIEEFQTKLENAYECSSLFYDVSCNLKTDTMSFQKLIKRNKAKV